MKIEKTQTQMRKGILEYCIHPILKNREAYPSDIIQKLKNAKLLQYRWEESSSGATRKYYSIMEN